MEGDSTRKIRILQVLFEGTTPATLGLYFGAWVLSRDVRYFTRYDVRKKTRACATTYIPFGGLCDCPFILRVSAQPITAEIFRRKCNMIQELTTVRHEKGLFMSNN